MFPHFRPPPTVTFFLPLLWYAGGRGTGTDVPFRAEHSKVNFIKMVAVSERPTEALRGEESSAEPTATLRQLETGRPYGETLLKSALTEWKGRWRSRAVHAVDTAVKGVGMVWVTWLHDY